MVRDMYRSLRSSGRAKSRAWKVEDGVMHRRYASYEDYIAHQETKLHTLDLSSYDTQYRQLLSERLTHAGHVEPSTSVLCLAARIGTEVKAFHDLGCFALGIDLNPGPANRYVVHGDFHALQFPDASTDIVFTNSLDHVLELERVTAEVRRVLRSEGLFIVEAMLGRSEGVEPREYEAFFWNSIEQLVRLIEREGFELMDGLPFKDPWPGRHLTFRCGRPAG